MIQKCGFIACVDEYFNDIESEETDDESTEDDHDDDDDQDLIYEGYKAVLDSKSNDETLVRISNLSFLILDNFSVLFKAYYFEMTDVFPFGALNI